MKTNRIGDTFRLALKLTLAAAMLPATAAAVSMTAGVFMATPADAVPRRVRRACRADYKSLCPRYRPGTARMRNCMRANGSQLSWGCYEALRDHGYVDGRRSGRRRGSRRRY